jgi:hypothetical protein
MVTVGRITCVSTLRALACGKTAATPKKLCGALIPPIAAGFHQSCWTPRSETSPEKARPAALIDCSCR